jgi:hypothetical protein
MMVAVGFSPRSGTPGDRASRQRRLKGASAPMSSVADATRFRGGSIPWTEVHGYRRVVAPRPKDSERRPTRQGASPVDYHLSGFLNKPVNGPGKPGKECAEFRGNLPTRHRPAAICATTATSNCASGTRGTSSRSIQPRLNFALWACA